MDMDGFVSGTEIRDVFLQSGLPHTVLADIWYDIFFYDRPFLKDQ